MDHITTNIISWTRSQQRRLVRKSERARTPTEKAELERDIERLQRNIDGLTGAAA